MFYSQVILAKKGPLAKVWLAAHWGDKKLARPQIFATDIAQSVDTIVNPTMPLALRMSGHLLLGVVRIYSRKVKYVLHDCTEAMLKLQLAFHPKSSNGETSRELLEPGTGGGSGHATATATVANFGEYDQVHVVEGFCLPLPDQNEWILADDDDDDGGDDDDDGDAKDEARRHGNPTARMTAALHLTHTQGTQGTQSPQQAYQPPEEETWVPFDPEHEDEEDDAAPQNTSNVSEVELARAAGDSFLSGDETRRASSILDKSQLTMDDSSMALPQEEEEEPDFAHIPFDDEEDELANTADGGDNAPNRDDSLLQLSATSNTPQGEQVSGLLLLDGPSSLLLDGSMDSVGNNKRSSSELAPPKPKRRKRRKVIVDNDATELSNDHINQMLANASELVARQVHPAELDDDDDDGDGGDENNQAAQAAIYIANGNPPSLTQPFLGTDSPMHPALAQLWTTSFYRALDQPCPFEKREVEDEVEQVRRDADGDEASRTSELGGITPLKEDPEGEHIEEPEDFVAPPMDDDDDEEEEYDALPVTFDDDEEEEDLVAHAADEEDLGLGLGLGFGLVNELQIDEDDDEAREAIGEHTGTKWHTHTVKVLKLLQHRIRSPEDAEVDEDNGTAPKPVSLEFGDLAQNVNRRTASSCFIECLQLKTWDFLELGQEDEYGPITISAGPRFQEAPPNHA